MVELTGRIFDARERMPDDLKNGDRIRMNNKDRRWWQVWKPKRRLYTVKNLRTFAKPSTTQLVDE